MPNVDDEQNDAGELMDDSIPIDAAALKDASFVNGCIVAGYDFPVVPNVDTGVGKI